MREADFIQKGTFPTTAGCGTALKKTNDFAAFTNSRHGA
jgi:hypothetical protein